MYIMAPESISRAYFTNPSISLCVCKCIPPIVARQRLGEVYPSFHARQLLGKHVPAATNTSNNRRTVGHVSLCIPLSLLGNNAVKTLPRQRRIVGGVIFYAVRVVPKEVGDQFFQELLITGDRAVFHREGTISLFLRLAHRM
jgi:hypothetical protein